jgi:hypothetical protein
MLSALGGLSLARPGALWIALALVPVVVLYFLRMRFKRKAIGSTYLWRQLAGSTSGGDALKRRSVLLLLLQAAAIALAAFAASGPSLVSRRILEPGIVFIIDVSASMGSRDCADPRHSRTISRVEAATVAASREIGALGDSIPVMTFACSAQARPLLSAPTLDKAAAAASLGRLAAGSEAFSEAPCADELAAWLSGNEGAWRARVFTDGGLDLGGERLSAVFGGELGLVAFGSSGASVGVTGLRLEGSDGGARASFTLWNGWPTESSVPVRIARGGKELAAAVVRAAPGWSRSSVELGGKIEDGAYSLSLERASKGLEGAPGDAYYLSIGRQRALSAILVGRSDPFLKAALAYGGISYATLEKFPAALAGESSAGGAAAGKAAIEVPDIAIVEAAEVPAGARCNLLVFGRPPSDAPLQARGNVSGAIASTGSSHPLSRFVSWEGARAEAGMGYALRGKAVVLATIGGVPSLVAWEREGYRCLACGIDLSRSDLGLKSAFPVLLQNFFQWCVPPVDDQSAYTLVAGESARRAEPDSFRVRGGVDLVRSGPVVALTARETGLFEWEAGTAKGYIAANVPSSELDAAPRTLRIAAATGNPLAAATEKTLVAAEHTRSTSLGGIAAALLALCLAAEWLAWKGRAKGHGKGAANRAPREGDAS